MRWRLNPYSQTANSRPSFLRNNDPENSANVSLPFLAAVPIIHPRQVDKSMMAKIYYTVNRPSTGTTSKPTRPLKIIGSMVCVYTADLGMCGLPNRFLGS